MPEIPILASAQASPGATQLQDTRSARMMGDAVSDLGQATFEYGNMLAKNARALRAKQDQLEADEANALYKEAILRARAQERVAGDMNDASGVFSVDSVKTATDPVKEQLMARMSSDGARRIFQTKATQTHTDSVTDTLSMAVKGNAENVLAKRTARVNANAALAAADPMKLGEYLTTTITQAQDDAFSGLIPQSEALAVEQADAQAVILAATDSLTASGDFENAKAMLKNHAQYFTPDEMMKRRGNIDKAWADKVNLDEASLRLKKSILTETREENYAKAAADIMREKEAAVANPFMVEVINEKITQMSVADPMSYPPEKMNALRNYKSSKEVLNDSRQEILWWDQFFRPGIKRNYVAARDDLYKRGFSDPKIAELQRLLQNMKDQESRDPMASKLIDIEIDRIKADVDANWELTGRGFTDGEMKRVQADRVKEFLLRVHKNGPTSVDGVRSAVKDFQSTDYPTYANPSAPITRGTQQASPEETRKSLERVRSELDELHKRSAPRSLIKPKFDEVQKLEGLLRQQQKAQTLRGN